MRNLSNLKKRQSSVKDIAEVLEVEIISGRLKANERLVEMEVSRRFGVSRTPVREAMRILESKGYVVLMPHKGWKVANVSLEEVKEAFILRAHLSALSAEMACGNLENKDLIGLEKILDEMSAANQHGDVSKYFNLNVKFHEIIEMAGNFQILPDIMRILDKKTHRYRFLALSLPGRLAKSLAEHSSMLTAFKQNNSKNAAIIAKESALNAGNLVIEYFFKYSSKINL